MATTTHVIHSYYDPADREKLERETGQRSNDHFDPWQTEHLFATRRRFHAPPSFVPATISYDQWGVPSHTFSQTTVPEKLGQPPTSTAEWYRSLTAASSREARLPRPSSALSPHYQDSRPAQSPQESITKNDWFIRKALHSVPSTKPSSPASFLADIFARDPPPSEGRYTPPVWLHIGPSNRGFKMLQRCGWNEGEGLGAHVVRRVARVRDVEARASSSTKVEGDVERSPVVIDLTLSDSEASEDVFQDYDDSTGGSVQTQAYTGVASDTQRSLLTPLPTVLKADRLGIGLKAKTEGPYKQSKKRVTHSAAALTAHIKSAEEMRRNKAAVGRGRRGFAKIRKREEDRRKAMLAYLNE